MRPMNRRNMRSENSNLLALLDSNANSNHQWSRTVLDSDSRLLVVGSMELQNTVDILDDRVLYILLDTPLCLRLPELGPVSDPLVVVLLLPSLFLPSPLPLPPSLSPCDIDLPLLSIDNDNTSIRHRPNSTFLSCAEDTWGSRKKYTTAWLACDEP
jgi:hypothetical protein